MVGSRGGKEEEGGEGEGRRKKIRGKEEGGRSSQRRDSRVA